MNLAVGRRAAGAVVGLVSAGAALAVGELVAAFVRPEASPVIVVGNRFILLTPEPVKRWAIRYFGTSDKTALLTGIYVVIGVFAVVVGRLALQRLAYGLLGLGILAAIGVYAALTTHDARGGDVVPVIVGALAAAAVMRWLVALAERAEPDAPLPDSGTAAADRLLADRRNFLAAGVGAAALAVITGSVGRMAQRRRFDVAQVRSKVTLPPPVNAARAVAIGTDLGKSGVPWQTPNAEFYRIDTALTIPQIDPKDWRLRIRGMVDREIVLTYDDVLSRPQIERWITLCCVSNEVGGHLVGNARFQGTRLADVLREAGLQPGADQLVMRSSDGMTIGAPTAVVMDGRDALIAVGMNGEPLPVKHGFPARIVVPGLYGYVSACKWVVDIEATTFDDQAYWVQGGWAQQTDIKLMSRIDRPGSGDTVPVGQTVAIAGVAWDQHVGVSRVEVQVDRGPWQEARLAPVPSTDTWRQWVLPWTPAKAGSYAVRVRAYDAHGTVQDDRPRDVFPAGATGLHTITVRAR